MNVYESAAARDTWKAKPNVGDVVVLKDTGEVLVYYGTQVGWKPPFNLPWGRIATVAIPEAFRQFTNVMNLEPALGTIAFTPVAGRRYEIQWRLEVETKGSGQAGDVGMALVTVFGGTSAASLSSLSGGTAYTLDGYVLPVTTIPSFYDLRWRRQIRHDRDITALITAGDEVSLSFQYAYGSPLPGTYAFTTTTDGLYGAADPGSESSASVYDVGPA